MRRFSLVVIVAALSLIASASTATAQVTVGQIGAPNTNCQSGDWAEPTVSSGPSYVIPVTGTLTSWSHIARVASGQRMKVKVFRQVPGLTLTYTVVGQDVPRDLNSGALNTFATSIPVQAGDVLGMTALTAQGASGVGCGFGPVTETVLYKTGDAPNGSGVSFESLSPANRLNISAVIQQPSGPAGTVLTCKGQRVTIVGTDGPDEIVGTTGRDVIDAQAGRDEVSGLGGNDVICGAKGNDTLKGGKGKDTLLGQKGNDKLKGAAGNDKLSGKKGKDKLEGGGGKDNLKGGGGKDVCIGGKANDSASKCEVEKSI